MNNGIRHSGVVFEIEDGCIKVRIIQTSACASCKIAGQCNASESKEKIIEVYGQKLPNLKVGDSVEVTAARRTGYLAVILSSVMPLLLLMGVLLTVLSITGNEVAAALSSMGVLVPYYLILYIMKTKIQSQLSFHIETTHTA